jgi:hypothetical protein
MKGLTVIDYTQKLTAAKRKLRRIRDKEKAEKNTAFDEFYFTTAQTLRSQFGAQVSAGWVREQCTKDTDPSYLRVGALMNFLAQYQDDTEVADRGPRVEELPEMTEEEVAEERDRAKFERLKAEAEAKRAQGLKRKPNALMKQMARKKR